MSHPIKPKKVSIFKISPLPSPSLKTPSIRSRLSKLCQEGQLLIALQRFDTLPRPTTVICNSIIIGFICNNLPFEAILFYSKLKSCSLGTNFDSYTYSSTLKACAKTRSLKIGKAIHCHLIRCLPNPSRIVYNSLLNMFSSCLSNVSYFDYFKDDLVHKVFDAMRKRDVVAWNTVISCVGDFKNANVLYGMLVKIGSKYLNDLFIVSSAIFMFAELGRVDFARKVFDHCVEENTKIWNTMIGGYVQNNCLVEGIDLFVQAVKTEQTVLDDVIFLSALTAISLLQCLDLAQQLHAFNGMDDEVLMLVYEMQNQGFAIDSVTVTALLFAASNLRNQEIRKQTHAYLLRHGIHFEGMGGYLIDMYAKCGLIRPSQQIFERGNHGLVEEAFVTFRQMLEKNVMPNAVALASILPTCNPVGSAINYAESVFTKLPKKKSATYTTMILGCGQHGMGERALSLFHSMQKSGIEPDAITFVAILSACNHSGLVHEELMGVVEAYDFVKQLGEAGNVLEIWGSPESIFIIYFDSDRSSAIVC
ncbi:unnamed protein product [Dovyalis caffra]|uniref:Pentatricopeptide repeat-containing protein n=1 Tax=Dovyalis caffra TaxID=77055 RepID=A0AAV1R5R9_9ROSI|nr:unnamed protein product [Dovyalis caffra]